jgi:diguanylate cyclase (GGDEF)-like protein
MSLRIVFLLCFAVACLPGVAWSAWMAARAQSEWVDASSAVRMAEAMGDALQLMEVLSIERGLLQERALSDGPVEGDMPLVAARDDALLDRTQASMRRAGLPDEAVTQSRDILRIARARVAEAIVRPVSERDPGLVAAIMVQLYGRLGAVEGAMARAERAAARDNARVGALVAVGGLVVEMRAAAGWRSTNLSAWLGGRGLSPSQLDEAMYMTGKVQSAWERLQRQVLIVGNPPRLAAAIVATREGFFRLAEPRYREVLAIARAGGQRPTTMTAWRHWTVEALAGTLLARNAAITEAMDYGTALVFEANTNLAIAAASMLGMVVLGAGALLVLLRRLVLPVQHLTAAVVGLAGGDVTALVPERGRHDEIGAMAAAIEVFRQNAVELRQTNLRFDAALSNMSQGLAMYDAAENLVVTNTRLCPLACVPPGSLHVGMTYREVLAVTALAGHFPGRTIDEVYADRRGLKPVNGEHVIFEEQRGDSVVAISSRTLPDGGWLFTIEDITERRRNEARITHIAHHDALTGMANRVLFYLRLQEALTFSRRGERFSVLCMDLDRFKVVNDTLGHAVGDALLQAVSTRLRAEVRETDTVARLGGDEFAILQRATEQPALATALADRLIVAIGAPYEIAGNQINVGVSIGITVAAGEDENSETLMKNADMALYRAKAEGRGIWRFFAPEMNAYLQARRLLELDLRSAVETGQFTVHYQPVMNLHTRQITCFEALVRWQHPQRGLVSPAEFIPLAEEVGLIGAIGEWVLLRACTEAASWPDAIKVAVNLSAVQFRAGSKLADTVAAILRTSGLASARLELEVTETAMLQDTEETLATLHRLKVLGVTIAMDDFGTGYSSLSHLRRFPFDRVKVDQSFVRGLGEADNDCTAIVHAVVALCANLGIAVTAEGVETEAQMWWLAAEGTIEAQGYLFSRPVAAGDVPALIASGARGRGGHVGAERDALNPAVARSGADLSMADAGIKRG